MSNDMDERETRERESGEMVKKGWRFNRYNIN